MKKLFFLFLFLNSLSFFAQHNEEDRNDCTYAKEIIVPFNYHDSAHTGRPLLNQTVFYSFRDQFSFWYKIIAKENTVISFKAKAINDSDTYAMYVYQYNEADFCNKVYAKKIGTMPLTFFKEKLNSFNAYDLGKKTFTAQKGNIYYISVLNTSLGNCGHDFEMHADKDTLKVRALHMPCKRQVEHLKPKEIVAKKPEQKDSLKASIKIASLHKDTIKKDSLPPGLYIRVSDAEKKTPLNAKVHITDQESLAEQEAERIKTGEYYFKPEKGKKYKLKSTTFGYKRVEKEIVIEKEMTMAELMHTPYKAGESIILRSIYFYPNTYALKKESAPELQKLLEFLLDNESVEMEIQGHTNGDHHIAKNKAYESLGPEWNYSGSAKTLSQKRAESIKEYLVKGGVKENRLQPKGYGGSRPIIKDPQNNEEAQDNIRVEITILKN